MTDFLRRYGQWGIVAGAAEGIGAAFCEELARKGMTTPGFSNRMTYFLLTRILPRRLSTMIVNRTMGSLYKRISVF